MKALIFGANGQDGHYLARLLQKRGIEAIGISRNGPWVRGSVACMETVEQLVKIHVPDMIFHLAANSTTAHEAIRENHETIALGTLNILESVQRWSKDSKVFITGSGLQFVNLKRPIAETDAFAENNPYTIVRNYSVNLSRYFRGLGFQVYVGYLFHHESPRRGDLHISQKIVRAVQRVRNGSQETIEIGDLAVRKEWTFAGDVAEGILALMTQDSVFEATIGSGRVFSIQDWLEQCFKEIGKDWRAFVKVKPGFHPEYELLVSNPMTINSLGWEPKTTFAELAQMMIESKVPPPAQ